MEPEGSLVYQALGLDLRGLSGRAQGTCRLLGQVGITHYAIAALMLGGIERCISKLDQVMLELGVIRVDGDANTDREALEGLRCSGKKLCFFHRPPQALSNMSRART